MDQYQEIVFGLKSKGVLFDKGMSLLEIEETEKLYNISFPVELNAYILLDYLYQKIFIIGVTHIRRMFNELSIY